MSTKALVTTLIVFGLLVGVAVLLNQGGPQKAQSTNGPTPILEIDPASIRTIEVVSDGDRSTVRRAESGGWVYVADDLEWPVRPDAPNTMLRVLGSVSGSDPGSDETGLGDRVCTINLTLEDGSTRTIEVSEQTVGGRSLARTGEGKTAIIGPDLLDAATRPGPRGWRVADALPGVGPIDTSRVTIETPDASIALARVDGAWQMRAPVGARANAEAVNGLLQTLAAARAGSFIDPPGLPASSIMKLDAPGMVITCERDLRMIDDAGNVSVQTNARQLRLGGPAGADGASVYAAPDAAPSFVLVLKSDLATSIPTSPRHYLATTATGVHPSEVWMVVIQPDSGASIGRRRHLDQWLELRPDGSTADAASEPVEELLTFLAETPGEPDIASGDMRSLARVDLLDSEGGVLDRITIGYNADGRLVARSGRIMWTYGLPEPPAILAVPSFGDLPAMEERPEVPEQDPDSPIKPK